MIAVSLVSKVRKFLRLLRCELREGHRWVVLFSPQNPYGSYDVLLECKKCGKRIWRKSYVRLKAGDTFNDFGG